MTTTDLTDRIQARDGVAVVVYTKHDCRQCDMTKGQLDKEGIVYTAVNVEEDTTAYDYVTETLGRRQMPVVVAATLAEDVIWSGFQPQMIREHITHRADAAWKTIALLPPKPVLNIPRQKPTVALCSSCDKPLRETNECSGCSD